MPNFDKTGPEGKGPKTGRGLGKCTNPENEKRGLGRGLGRNQGAGRGQERGRGWRLFGRRKKD